MVRNEYEVLYGGARGGGKTDAGMAWLLYPIYDWIQAKKDKDEQRAKELSKYRGLVIRLNAKDLDDWIERARIMFTPLMPEFVGKPTQIKFPNGAIVRTGHLKDENAYGQYQGHEYQRILIEELTQIPSEDDYEKLISSCRSTIPYISPQIFATTNPGNVGHMWVKKRWNIGDRDSWGKPMVGMSALHPTTGEPIIRHRIFIHAKIEDNPKLIETDPGYVAQIESISDQNLRKAWRDGDWDNPIIPGAIYKDEIDRAWQEERITHVPHDPKHPVYTYWDIGRDATPIIFMQLIGSEWRIIDFYEGRNKSFDHYAEILRSKPYWYGQHFGPHDLAKTDMAGENIWSLAQKQNIIFTIVPKEPREDGIQAVKMKFPRLKIDQSLTELIQRLTAYRREYDEDRKVYKDIPVHDWASHAADALRYWAVQPDPVTPNEASQNFNLYSNDYS